MIWRLAQDLYLPEFWPYGHLKGPETENEALKNNVLSSLRPMDENSRRHEKGSYTYSFELVFFCFYNNFFYLLTLWPTWGHLGKNNKCSLYSYLSILVLISGVYLATDVYHLILTNFIFQTVLIWHLHCLCRCWCDYAQGCLWRNEVDWQQILQLEKRQRQGVAEGIEESNAGSNPCGHERPIPGKTSSAPALNGQKVRVLSIPWQNKAPFGYSWKSRRILWIL